MIPYNNSSDSSDGSDRSDSCFSWGIIEISASRSRSKTIEISDRNDKTNLEPKFSLIIMYNNKKNMQRKLADPNLWIFFLHKHFSNQKRVIYIYIFPEEEKEKNVNETNFKKKRKMYGNELILWQTQKLKN